eukprot:gene6346-2972_t
MSSEPPRAPVEDLSNVIAKGLTPEELCQTYFRACWDQKPDVFLATLALEMKGDATTLCPGPFFSSDWERGRVRVEKYMVSYKSKGPGQASKSGHEPVLTLQFEPLYGPVPGYDEGSPLGGTVKIVMKQQGGENGEWRITKGSY